MFKPTQGNATVDRCATTGYFAASVWKCTSGNDFGEIIPVMGIYGNSSGVEQILGGGLYGMVMGTSLDVQHLDVGAFTQARRNRGACIAGTNHDVIEGIRHGGWGQGVKVVGGWSRS